MFGSTLKANKRISQTVQVQLSGKNRDQLHKFSTPHRYTTPHKYNSIKGSRTTSAKVTVQSKANSIKGIRTASTNVTVQSKL